MASGKTHFSIELLLLLFLAGLSFYYSIQWWNSQVLVFAVLGYIVSMMFMSPDMDLYRNKSLVRWKGFRWIWWPYSQLFKHRGVSHSLILGSVTRVFYLFMIGVLIIQLVHIFDIAKISLDANYLVSVVSEPLFLSFFVGIWLNDLVHIVVDKVS